MKLKFYDSEESVRIDIYDAISSEPYDYWTGSENVTVKTIQDELKNANGKPLEIHINSGGGEVFEGFAIYNNIRDYVGKKIVVVDGICASIASVIALAGDEVRMNKASMMMIHNASSGCYGTAEDMRKVADALESINGVIRQIYKDKTGLDDDKLVELMNAETYLSAEDALAYGFCDSIIEEERDEEQTMNALNALNVRIEANIKSLNQLRMVDGAVTPVSKDEPIEVRPTLQDKRNTAIRNWLKGAK